MKLTAVLAVLAAVAGNVSASPAGPAPVAGDVSPRVATSNGNVWWHTCANCRCDPAGAREGFQGGTGCMPISTAIRAMGLTRTGGLMTSCALYSDANCRNEVQSTGVRTGETYACTVVNQDSRSIACWYNS
ncbi:hypothetical protein V8F06_012254 [Rhypophila decipiens]